MLQEILIRHIDDQSIQHLNSRPIISLLSIIIERFKGIDLDFTGNNLSQQEVLNLICGIFEFEQKINIKLNFSNTGIDDDIAIIIAQLIGANMCGSLELNLSGNDITDDGFYHIVSNLYCVSAGYTMILF